MAKQMIMMPKKNGILSEKIKKKIYKNRGMKYKKKLVVEEKNKTPFSSTKVIKYEPSIIKSKKKKKDKKKEIVYMEKSKYKQMKDYQDKKKKKKNKNKGFKQTDPNIKEIQGLIAKNIKNQTNLMEFVNELTGASETKTSSIVSLITANLQKTGENQLRISKLVQRYIDKKK